MAAPVKYTVFISSTHDDLQDEREQVTDAILKLGHIPCGMEQFSAGAGRGWEVITQTIDLCDYYVLIVAGRYGSDFPGQAKSWTEKEYEYAKTKGLDVIAFLRDEKSFYAADMDTDPVRVEKRKAFLSRINKECRREVWTNADDLCTRVTMALTKQIADDNRLGKSRPGWYRGDDLPVDRDMAKAMALQIAELAELRKKLESLPTAAPKARVELQMMNGQPIPAKLEIVNPRYELQDDTSSGRWVWLDEMSRLCWVHLRLFNSGAAPARAVRARFWAQQVERVVLHKVGTASEELMNKMLSINVTPWYLDKTEEVYVDINQLGDNAVAYVCQRASSVGVGREQNLVRLGFMLQAHASQAKLHYSIDEEGGSRCSGELTIEFELNGNWKGSEAAIVEHVNE